MLNSSLNELLYDKSADEIERIFERAQNPQIGKVTDPTDTENMEQLSYIKAKKFVDMILQKVISLKGQTDDLKKQLLSAESQEDIEKLLGDNTGIIDLNFLNTLTRKDMTGNVNINPVNLRKGKDQIEGAKSEDVSGYHKGSQIIPVVLEVDGSSVGVGESFYVALIPAIGSAIRPENEDLHRTVFGIEIPKGETTIWTDVKELPIVMVNGESELEDLKKGVLTSGNQSLTKFKTLALKLNQRKTQQPTKTKETFDRKGTMIHEQYNLSDAFLVTEHKSPSKFMQACINSIRKKYYKKNKPASFEVEDIKKIFDDEYKKLKNKNKIENKLKTSKGLIINAFQEGERKDKILSAFEAFVKEKVSPSQSATSSIDIESTNDDTTLSLYVQKRQPESSEQEVESSEAESTEEDANVETEEKSEVSNDVEIIYDLKSSSYDIDKNKSDDNALQTFLNVAITSLLLTKVKNIKTKDEIETIINRSKTINKIYTKLAGIIHPDKNASTAELFKYLSKSFENFHKRGKSDLYKKSLIEALFSKEEDKYKVNRSELLALFNSAESKLNSVVSKDNKVKVSDVYNLLPKIETLTDHIKNIDESIVKTYNSYYAIFQKINTVEDLNVSDFDFDSKLDGINTLKDSMEKLKLSASNKSDVDLIDSVLEKLDMLEVLIKNKKEEMEALKEKSEPSGEESSKEVTEAEVGEIYSGKVNNIKEYGVFIEIAPDISGLVHKSELTDHRFGDIEDYIKVGDEIDVKCIGITRDGKIRLSHIEAMKDLNEESPYFSKDAINKKESEEGQTDDLKQAEEEESTEGAEKQKTIDDIELEDIRKLLSPLNVSDKIDVDSFKHNYLDIKNVKDNLELWEAGCKNEKGEYERVDNVKFFERLPKVNGMNVTYAFNSFEYVNEHIENLLACDYPFVLYAMVESINNNKDINIENIKDLAKEIKENIGSYNNIISQSLAVVEKNKEANDPGESESGEIKQAEGEEAAKEYKFTENEIYEGKITKIRIHENVVLQMIDVLVTDEENNKYPTMVAGQLLKTKIESLSVNDTIDLKCYAIRENKYYFEEYKPKETTSEDLEQDEEETTGESETRTPLPPPPPNWQLNIDIQAHQDMLKDLQNPSQQSHEAAKDIAQPEVRGYIESLDATPDTTFPNFSQEKVFNFSPEMRGEERYESLEQIMAANILFLNKRTLQSLITNTNTTQQQTVASLKDVDGDIKAELNKVPLMSPDKIKTREDVNNWNTENSQRIVDALKGLGDTFAKSKYVESFEKKQGKDKEEKSEPEIQQAHHNIFASKPLASLLFENNGAGDNVDAAAQSIADRIQLANLQSQLRTQEEHNKEEMKINAEHRKEMQERNREQYQIARITQYQNYSALEHRIQTRIAQCIGDLETSILNIKERQLDRERSEDSWLSRQGLFGEYDEDLSLRDGHVRNFFIGGGNFLSNLAGKSIGSIVRLAGKDATKKVVGASLASGAVTAAGSSITAALSGFSAVATATSTMGIGAGGTAALTALGGLASSIAIGLPGIAIGAYVSYKAYEAIADHLNDEQSRNRLVTSNQRSIDRKIDQIAIDRAKSERKRQIATLNSVLVEVCSRLKAIRGNEYFTRYIQNNAGDSTRIANVVPENYNMFASRSLSELIFEEVDKKEDSISWNDIKNILSKDKYFSDLLKNDKNNFIAGSIYTLIEDITGCGSQIKGLPAFDTKNYSKELYNQHIPKEVSVGQPMIPSSKTMRQSQSTFVGMPKTGDDSCSVMQILNILNNAGRRDLMISFLSSLSDTSGEKQYFKEGDSLNSTMKAMSSDKDLEKNVRSEAKQVAKESNKIISDIRVGLFKIKQSDYDKLLKLENMFINLHVQAKTIQKTLEGLGLKVKDEVKADILPESGRQQVLDYFCEIVDDNKAEKNLTLDFVYNFMKNIINIEFVIDLGDKKQLPINEEDIISLIIFNSALILLMEVEKEKKKSPKAYKKSSQVHKYVFKDIVGKIKQLETDDDDQHKKLIGITSKGKELKLERNFVYKSGIKNLLD